MTETTVRASRDPVPVALALLERRWPPSPVLNDSAGPAAMAALQADPRYLIGRLQQALEALLAADLPPMDSQTALLSQALADAISWRQHQCTPCGCAESMCGPCTASWQQADRYHALALALGAVGEIPPAARAGAGREKTAAAAGGEPGSY